MKHRETQYGFEYGPVEVERLISDDKRGWVVLGIKTRKYPDMLQIYVTKTGKVRVFAKGEWKPEARP